MSQFRACFSPSRACTMTHELNKPHVPRCVTQGKSLKFHGLQCFICKNEELVLNLWRSLKHSHLKFFLSFDAFLKIYTNIYLQVHINYNFEKCFLFISKRHKLNTHKAAGVKHSCAFYSPTHLESKPWTRWAVMLLLTGVGGGALAVIWHLLAYFFP